MALALMGMPPITEELVDVSMLPLKFCGEHEFMGRQPLIGFMLYELVVDTPIPVELPFAFDAESPYNFCGFDSIVIVIWRTDSGKVRAYLKSEE